MIKDMAKSAHFDLVIIGSGSGNTLVTPYWEDKNVAIIDGGVFGGTCLNNGCIPTKMFLYPADHALASKQMSKLGVDLEVKATDFAAIRDRVFGLIDPISAGGKAYRAESEHTTLYAEMAQFTGEKELTTASGHVVTGDQIVIATGSRPLLPADIEGLDHPAVHTNETIMRLAELPKRVVVVGGGFIASEFAAMFHGLGANVKQVNRSGKLLRYFDDEIAEVFTESAAATWDVELGQQIVRVEDGGEEGTGATVVTVGKNHEEKRHPADVVLVALGRVPNSDNLNLPATAVATHTDGRIQVNAHQQVLNASGAPIDGLWALGDVSCEYQLKHVANHEARTVAHNLEHPDDLVSSDHQFIPSAVFTIPQIATVGLTEAQAMEKFGRSGIKIKKQYYRDTAYGWAMGADEQFVKIILEAQTNKIIGCHILGEQASTLIQPVLTAMQFDIDAYQLARGQYWIHPALSEVVENALLGALDDSEPPRY